MSTSNKTKTLHETRHCVAEGADQWPCLRTFPKTTRESTSKVGSKKVPKQGSKWRLLHWKCRSRPRDSPVSLWTQARELLSLTNISAQNPAARDLTPKVKRARIGAKNDVIHDLSPKVFKASNKARTSPKVVILCAPRMDSQVDSAPEMPRHLGLSLELPQPPTQPPIPPLFPTSLHRIPVVRF